MKARINRHLFNQTRFDSGALTPADFVVHPYKEAGYYQADVSRHGQHRYTFSFVVTPDSKKMQISVDLAAMERKQSALSSACADSDTAGGMQLAPGGYGLFYTATGSGGYSIKTYPLSATEKDRDQVFDSTALQTDDLFGITLLRPGYYVMRDTSKELQCRLQVDPVTPGKERYVPPEALHLDGNDLKNNKNNIRLIQAQGLVYRSHPDARILIELEKSIDTEQPGPPQKTPSKGKKTGRKSKTGRRQPVASWNKPGVKR